MSSNQLVLDHKPVNYRPPAVLIGLAIIILVLLFSYNYVQSSGVEDYIVQASDVVTAAAMVEYVGGEVTHELGIINAVGAKLSASQLRRLGSAGGSIRIYLNSAAQIGDPVIQAEPSLD